MRKSTIPVAKTKALISFTVTAKLTCVFVFAYADCWFSHEAVHLIEQIYTQESGCISICMKKLLTEAQYSQTKNEPCHEKPKLHMRKKRRRSALQ